MSGPYAVVVGGTNIDLGGVAAAPLVFGDSNPGTVRSSPGGVGRNIAHNLALLGVDTRLVTVLGDDAWACQIEASCRALGIDLSAALRCAGQPSPTYLYIADAGGEMALALSDMALCRRLTPQHLAAHEALLQNAGAVVVDANIPAESIAWLAGHIRAPLFADPVSAAKAGKLRPVLGRLHTLKPNRLEAQCLTGITITDRASLFAAADALLATGLRQVYISLGGHGVLAAAGTARWLLPCIAGRRVSTTGCGDAFMAALVRAQLDGAAPDAAARLGLAAASVAMESGATVNPALDERTVCARAGLAPEMEDCNATEPLS